MKTFRISVLVVLLLPALRLHSQSANTQQNLPKYYFDPIHFGFYLGVNYANFIVTPVDNW